MTDNAKMQRLIQVGELVRIWPSDYDQPVSGVIVEASSIGSDNEPNPTYRYRIHTADGEMSCYRDEVFVDEEEPIKSKWSFSKFALPLIKRVFPSMIAQQFISVQPMTAPSGLIFFMDFKYGDKSKEKDEP